MDKIFINYRRDDTLAQAQDIYDILKEEFDTFFDKDGSIVYGHEFPSALKMGIERSDVIITLIGKEFANSFKQRVDGIDYVQEELRLARASKKAILPILVDGTQMPQKRELPSNLQFICDLHAYNLLSSKIALFKEDLFKTINALIPKESNFIKEVLRSVQKDRLVVIFSQDFTPIESYIEQLREVIQNRFKDACYMVSIPPYLDDEEEYFSLISQNFHLTKEIKKISDWYIALRERLQSSPRPVLLFITDIENGNPELNRKFATSLRNLKSEFRNFHAICVGRKDLAKLVYAEGHLSPLNTATELFIPEDNLKLDEEKIIQQFHTLYKYGDILCQYLKKEEICRFSVWTNREVINQLFWKNLLIKRGTQLVWRGEHTKALAKDVLACAK